MQCNLLIHLSLQSSHRCLFQPTVIVPHAHWEVYGCGSLPLHYLVSDSATPHYLSDPLPQSFVGSSYNRTALNLDSERSSRVPYNEQGTPAHLGLDQKKSIQHLHPAAGGGGGSVCNGDESLHPAWGPWQHQMKLMSTMLPEGGRGLYKLEFLQFKFCPKILCASCSVFLRISAGIHLTICGASRNECLQLHWAVQWKPLV